MKRLFIANRGEIALRILRAAEGLGLETVAATTADEPEAPAARLADLTARLPGHGVAAWLDAAALVAAARAAGCDAVHPGYGFLSENPAFGRACQEAGLIFVGPAPDTLALFGDKGAARALARQMRVPVLEGTDGPTSLAEATAFLAGLGPGGAVMVKAIAGGGGRGMRPALSAAELAEVWPRARSEALGGFGNGDLYAERFIPRARHVEVQLLGDGSGAVTHLWERECSLQRRRQKIIEVAPAAFLPSHLRAQLLEAALTLGRAARYRGAGTAEFLVDLEALEAGVLDHRAFAFVELNARLQVEHTVTEEITGLDIVELQLRLAAGSSLAALGLDRGPPPPRGTAVQLRVNMETMDGSGEARPAGGTLSLFEPPSGRGIRVDTAGHAGMSALAGYDSLLAKQVTWNPGDDLAAALRRAERAAAAFRIAGIQTNLSFLRALLRHPQVQADRIDTRFVERHAAELAGAGAALGPGLPPPGAGAGPAAAAGPAAPEGTVPVPAPMLATVVSIDVAEGEAVPAGRQIAVLDAMKMEHVVVAPTAGIVRLIAAQPRQTLTEGAPLLFLEPASGEAALVAEDALVNLERVRPDLQESIDRHALTLDENRPEAVARRRRTGQRTARENLADLLDPGSFIEYGALTMAAQRTRRSLDDLKRNTPADGMVAGLGTINGRLFPEERARVAALAYDYTVLAGTQGKFNHKKTDRVLDVAHSLKLPTVLYAEGGGGRPGEVDAQTMSAAGLDTRSFKDFARLSGLVPTIGIVSGYCFAGNAALLGCADVIIATENSSVGMGGPAMIEGGGLGVYHPMEVGPVSVQGPNGVHDLIVRDEAEATALARRYLSYFQGRLGDWQADDQRRLRHLIPENRLRSYEIRTVIEALADQGSVLELRRTWGHGMITALIRIEGRPLGLIANNPRHLGGAIDADAAEKAARFLQLCEAHALPVVSLCDTPGFMVGPEAEKTALVRKVSRMFVVGASLTVPFVCLVLRKGYGLGAQAMAAGGFHVPLFTISWPTGEFGGMGLEGAVRLGYRKELEAVPEGVERDHLFRTLVDEHYARGKAINVAAFLEIDAVIDPADSRRWILGGLASAPPRPAGEGRRRPFVDTW